MIGSLSIVVMLFSLCSGMAAVVFWLRASKVRIPPPNPAWTASKTIPIEDLQSFIVQMQRMADLNATAARWFSGCAATILILLALSFGSR